MGRDMLTIVCGDEEFAGTRRRKGDAMKLGIWDYLTFLSFFVIGIGGLAAVVFVLGLPGRIAHARKHPEAEAVNMMGWLGFLAIIPWVQAFIWAFKPTDVVDIRRFPREEQRVEEEEYAKAELARGKKQKHSPAESPARQHDENR